MPRFTRRDATIVELAARGVSDRVIAILADLSVRRTQQIVGAGRVAGVVGRDDLGIVVGRVERPASAASINFLFLAAHHGDRRRNGRPMAIGPRHDDDDRGEDEAGDRPQGG